jgi:hypothetical protein
MGAACTLGLRRRIDAQNNSDNFLPVGALSLGTEQAEVRYRVPLVITGENGCRWSDIVNCGVTWRRRHDRLLSWATNQHLH